ncbi:MAG: response regulator transcription factor [Betaproteobacteria bacterium]|jgi:DNA-binding response OmpR family regulator|nr:response regulator transcription factor [Betaproteobacteria bacterium]
MPGETILIIEDDPQIGQAIHFRLQREGFSPCLAVDTRSADEELQRNIPSLIILDIGLPNEDGFSWLNRKPELAKSIPILMLTARGKTDDKVRGLGLGADDYLTKPFEFAELLARIAAILRRRPQHTDQTIEIGNLLIQPDAKQVLVDGQEVELSPREYNVLMVLASQSQRVISKSQILQHLADHDLKAADLNDAAIEVIIHRIRKKLESASLQIETVRGFGYVMR